MNNILTKRFKDKDILFENIDLSNLYLNATKTAKEFNKDVREWRRSKQTIEYIDALSEVVFSHTTLIKGTDKSM